MRVSLIKSRKAGVWGLHSPRKPGAGKFPELQEKLNPAPCEAQTSNCKVSSYSSK